VNIFVSEKRCIDVKLDLLPEVMRNSAQRRIFEVKRKVVMRLENITEREA
jgi:hypothetical protein